MKHIQLRFKWLSSFILGARLLLRYMLGTMNWRAKRGVGRQIRRIVCSAGLLGPHPGCLGGLMKTNMEHPSLPWVLFILVRLCSTCFACYELPRWPHVLQSSSKYLYSHGRAIRGKQSLCFLCPLFKQNLLSALHVR